MTSTLRKIGLAALLSAMVVGPALAQENGTPRSDPGNTNGSEMGTSAAQLPNGSDNANGAVNNDQ